MSLIDQLCIIQDLVLNGVLVHLFLTATCSGFISVEGRLGSLKCSIQLKQVGDFCCMCKVVYSMHWTDFSDRVTAFTGSCPCKWAANRQAEVEGCPYCQTMYGTISSDQTLSESPTADSVYSMPDLLLTLMLRV